MQQLTSARLQQVVANLPELETLKMTGGAEMLHCLRLHSTSLLEVQLEGLNHLLTWDMDCPALHTISIRRCSGWGLRTNREFSDQPVAGLDLAPAFLQTSRLDVACALPLRGLFEERWLEALLDGHAALKLPALRRLALGHSSEEFTLLDNAIWQGIEIPRLNIACRSGHPALETLTLHNKLGLYGLVLRNLPALRSCEVLSRWPRLVYVVVDPALMQRAVPLELKLPSYVSVLHDAPPSS
ncbi:MAG: hypothetical protein WDW38_010282 [Sanguina aurantia]